jgi:hypothetical protein
MTRPTVLAALAGLVLTSVAPPASGAQCAPSQVKPSFAKPGSGSEVSSPVAVEGGVAKPTGCTTPTFTHVNLEFYRKAPATTGQPLQPVPGTWGDVKLQGGKFATTKKLTAGVYLVKGKLVQTGSRATTGAPRDHLVHGQSFEPGQPEREQASGRGVAQASTEIAAAPRATALEARWELGQPRPGLPTGRRRERVRPDQRRVPRASARRLSRLRPRHSAPRWGGRLSEPARRR